MNGPVRSVAERLAAEEGGPGAPPRSNGELVFEAPWESRSFGIAVALTEARTCDWERFRGRLIAEIGAWERAHAAEPDARWSYYERWLASLERLLVDDRLLSQEEIETRIALLAEHDDHEHDHDHGHDHDHHHDHDHDHDHHHDHGRGHGHDHER
jgi:nitrile hydratase accessory protein